MSDCATLENFWTTSWSVLPVFTLSANVSEEEEEDPWLVLPSPFKSCPNSASFSSDDVLNISFDLSKTPAEEIVWILNPSEESSPAVTVSFTANL